MPLPRLLVPALAGLLVPFAWSCGEPAPAGTDATPPAAATAAEAEVSAPPAPAPVVDPQAQALAALRAAASETPWDELDARLETLALEARGDLRAEITAYRRELEVALERRFAERLEETRRQVAAALGRRDYAGALDAWSELRMEAEIEGAGDIALDARRRRLEVIEAARADWQRTLDEVAALAARDDEAGARRRLEQAAAGHRGTTFEAAARTELQLLPFRLDDARRTATAAADVPEDQPVAGGDARAAATPAPAPRGRGARAAEAAERARVVGAAEERAAAGAWGEAATALEAVATALEPGDPARAPLLERAAALQALARLREGLIATLAEDAGRVGRVRLGRGSARIVGADAEGVRLDSGRDESVRWSWGEIPPDTLIEVFSRIAREPADRLAFGRVAAAFDRDDRALEMLARIPRDDAVRAEVDALAARLRGIPAPQGGFVVEDGRFLTPREAEDLELAREAARLGRELVRATGRRFDELYGRLEEIGDPAREALIEALTTRRDDRVTRARASTPFAQTGRLRAQLVDVLEERRKAALALIRDETRYPYPYAPNQAEVQAEVDALAARVEEVWKTPSIAAREASDAWRDLRAEIVELDARITALGVGSDLAVELDRELDAAIDMPGRSWSDGDARRIEEVATFNRRIKSSITAEEREVHDLTNAYRMMMGILPVKIDEALVLAARGHSIEMSELGYFAHTSPTPGRESPSDRGRLAGWNGGVAENIAMGQSTPAAAVQGWLHSSGHHRNILGARHTHLGCGRSIKGAYWTQNFGTGSSSRISSETIDDAE